MLIKLILASSKKNITLKSNKNQQDKYARLCKDALLYMKNSGMYMDEPLIQLLNQL